MSLSKTFTYVTYLVLHWDLYSHMLTEGPIKITKK